MRIKGKTVLLESNGNSPYSEATIELPAVDTSKLKEGDKVLLVGCIIGDVLDGKHFKRVSLGNIGQPILDNYCDKLIVAIIPPDTQSTATGLKSLDCGPNCPYYKSAYCRSCDTRQNFVEEPKKEPDSDFLPYLRAKVSSELKNNGKGEGITSRQIEAVVKVMASTFGDIIKRIEKVEKGAKK